MPHRDPAASDAAMSPQMFAYQLKRLFGPRGWQQAFARGTGLSPASVSRWASGEQPIPLYVAVLVEMMRLLARNNLPLPDTFEPSYDLQELFAAVRICIEGMKRDPEHWWEREDLDLDDLKRLDEPSN